MPLNPVKEKHTERVTEWVTGGPYAVAVEVEAIIYPNRPGEPYLTPETVRFLEQVAEHAEAGDVAALQRAGTVYVRLGDQAHLATADRIDGKQGKLTP